MRKSTTLMLAAAWVSALFLHPAAHAANPALQVSPSPRTLTLEQGFSNPPASAKPLVWWHWMNGNVTRDGITRDLEAIQRIGLGGVQIFTAHLETPVTVAKPIRYMSPEWLEMIRHAAAECDRLGLEMTIHSAAGWSETGGTWVKPDEAMQKLVWSETSVEGPKRFSAALPAPPSVWGPFQSVSRAQRGRKPPVPAGEKYFFRDVAVLAFRTPAGESASMTAAGPKISSDAPGFDARLVADGDLNTRQTMTFPATGERALNVRLDFAQPFEARALVLLMSEALPFEVQSSDGSGAWHTIATQAPGSMWTRSVPKTITFPVEKARSYRLIFKPRDDRQKAFDLGEIDLTAAARINRFEDKAGFSLIADYEPFPTPPVGTGMAVDPASIVDLSNVLGANGQLNWNVPPGRWTIMRFGHSATGSENGPAPEDARGLEVDKLDRPSVEAYFDGFMNPVKQALGPLYGKSLRYVLMDSWEAGLQNWTPRFVREFSRRRGYDPTRYLPAMAGKVIGSPQESDRFLEDVRRTLGDLVADSHYGAFKDRLHGGGLGLYAESVGISQPMFADGLQARGMPDIPMGEFWVRRKGLERNPDPDCKVTSSAAHIYGKPIAAAESFTAAPDKPAYGLTPYMMKPLGDLHFATGINRFIIHEYAHQPTDDRKPGFTLGPFGTQFNRQITWWEQARAWTSYLSRSQFLLQQGRFSGDVLYFYGEGVPAAVPPLKDIKPAMPAGYDYDFVNAEVLLGRIAAGKDGRLLLPDGTEYRVLVLTTPIATPAVLKKIQSLVESGVTVLGPRPQRSLGLNGYPAVDAEVARLAEGLWGPCKADTPCENKVGLHGGKVVTGKALADVLAGLGLPQDFKTENAAADASFVYFHRKTTDKTGDADLYFVANQSFRFEPVTLNFRVAGKAPELWDPSRGSIARAADWSRDGAYTKVRLTMDPAGSLFVVFRRPGAPPPARAIAAQATPRAVFEVQGPWQVKFAAKLGAPESATFDRLTSWHEHADEGIKYFSGTATYSTAIDLPAAARGKLILDLGEVKEFAEVSLNGKPLGVLWKPPFELDVSGLARPGKNQLEVRITNLWPNRLIRDAGLPEAQRLSWTTDTQYKKDSPLLPSGLLGPVRVLAR